MLWNPCLGLSIILHLFFHNLYINLIYVSFCMFNNEKSKYATAK
ncbi:hypothetical protein, partial [Plasmodium yoelii yoelii]